MTVPLILRLLLPSWTEFGAMRRLVCGPLKIVHRKSSEAELAPLSYLAWALCGRLDPVFWHQPGVHTVGFALLGLANLAVPPKVTVMSTVSPFLPPWSEIWMSVMWRGTSWPRLPEVRVTGTPVPV